MKTAKYFQRAV